MGHDSDNMINNNGINLNDRRGTQPLRLSHAIKSRRLACWLLLGCFLLALPGLTQAQGPDPQPVSTQRQLHLADVQLTGATRTSLETVNRFLPLTVGQTIDQAQLVSAVDELRDSGIFKTVAFYTRPGQQRGQIILVLEVEENGFDFRWAAGNTNLDGWYLVPAMVAKDNPFGRGGFFDLQWRLGFRHSGSLMRYGQTRAGDGNTYWGARLSAIATDRPYFYDGVEFSHEVRTAGLAAVVGRRYSPRSLIETGLNLEGVDAATSAYAKTASVDGSIAIDQEIPQDQLPAPISDAVGKSTRAILHLDWQHDTRAEQLRAGTPVAGLWGRLKSEFTLQEGGSFPGLQADLRAFKEVPGGVLATRLRASWVGSQALFYDRLYLGGMYSVRGFPTHSLSAPGGDTWLTSGSLEYRTRILGDSRGGTKLAGLFFLDAGAGGSPDQDDPYSGMALGAGYGVRMRVWWLDWVGVDVGFPLTDRPLDMRFQANASIGWSF